MPSPLPNLAAGSPVPSKAAGEKLQNYIRIRLGLKCRPYHRTEDFSPLSGAKRRGYNERATFDHLKEISR
jgi:hypothetical protein